MPCPSDPYYWGTQPPRRGGRQPGAPRVHPSQIRIDNAERSRVTDALCKHFADGRLDEAELNDRAGRAAAAKTRADLGPLLADLPPLDQPVYPEVAPMPRRSHPVLWVIALLLLAPLVIAGAVAVAGGAFGLAIGVAHGLMPLLLVIGVIYLIARRRGRRHHHHHDHVF